jgi:hypothetical protein
MAYCPPELLGDLAGLLAEVRTWAWVIEKKPNVFYLRRQSFLHFHVVEGGDVVTLRGRTGWVQRDLPRPISTTRRRAFLRELRTHYGKK